MADVRWSGKSASQLLRFLPRAEAILSRDDVVHVGPGESLAILGEDGSIAGVLGPGEARVSELPFASALGTAGVFGRFPVALFWSASAPVAFSWEFPLPPIADPASGAACAGASARATFAVAVTDPTKLLAAQHTPQRPIANETGERLARQALGAAFSTFWTQSREPVATREAPMQEAVPQLAATVLDAQGLAVSDVRVTVRLPTGFTTTPGSPLR